MDGSPPGPSVHGIIQARTLEWVSIVFSRGNLHDPGIEPGSPALQADYLPSEPLGEPNSEIQQGNHTQKAQKCKQRGIEWRGCSFTV